MSLKVSKMKMRSVNTMFSEAEGLEELEESVAQLRVMMAFYVAAVHVLTDLVAKLAQLDTKERKALAQYVATILTDLTSPETVNGTDAISLDLQERLNILLPVHVKGLATNVVSPAVLQFFLDRVRTSMHGSM